MVKKRKKTHWKRFLSAILAAAVTVTSIPVMDAGAANPLPGIGLEAYDYSRMESIMMDGKIITNRNNTTGEMQAGGIMPMSFGEMVYLQFALPYNTFYTMKVLDAGGADLGYLYAKFYTEHADGSVDSGYTSRGKSMDAIKLELKNFVYEMPYSPATNFFGIGLTGEVLPYRTLAEYYDFYELDPPEKASLPEDPEEELLPEEALDPEEELLPEEPSDSEEEMEDETTTQDIPDEDEGVSEDGESSSGTDTSEEDASAATDGDGDTSGDETPPADTDASEEDVSADDENIPAEETPATESPEEEAQPDTEEPTAEADESEEAGTPVAALIDACKSAAGFLKELTMPMRVYAAEPDSVPAREPEDESTDEDEEEPKEELSAVLADEPIQEETDETTMEPADTALPDSWVPEEELPEDFYIRRDFRVAPYAAGDQTILHNFVVWKGEVCDAAGGNIQYLQPGNYTIRIQSKAQSLQPVDIPFTIAGSGEGGALTPEDVLAAVFRDMIWFPGFASGYPTLKMCVGGDPVDLLSGGLDWTYTDLTLEGKNPLAFTRTYLSAMHDLDDSGLGNGWSHNYDYRAETFNNNVDVYLPNGGHISFFVEYDGTLRTNKGIAWHMDGDENGYVMTHDNGQTVYFNGDGQAVRIAEPNGNVVSLSYSDGKLSEVRNDSGSFRFSWSGDHIAAVTDSAGRTLSLSYEGSNLASVVNPDGDSFEYAYDGSHCMTEITDLNGNPVLQNTYNEDHKVIEQRMPDRGLMTYSYDPDSRTNTYHEEGGDTQTVRYDDRFRITSFTNDAGTETCEYDENSRLIAETDRNGNTTTYGYEGEYTYPSVTNYPDGTRTEYAYTAMGLIERTVQKDGTVISSTYDAAGNLTGTADANGGTTAYTYDGAGHLASSQDMLGNVTTYVSDEKGNITGMTDPEGNTSTALH